MYFCEYQCIFYGHCNLHWFYSLFIFLFCTVCIHVISVICLADQLKLFVWFDRTCMVTTEARRHGFYVIIWIKTCSMFAIAYHELMYTCFKWLLIMSNTKISWGRCTFKNNVIAYCISYFRKVAYCSSNQRQIPIVTNYSVTTFNEEHVLFRSFLYPSVYKKKKKTIYKNNLSWEIIAGVQWQ